MAASVLSPRSLKCLDDGAVLRRAVPQAQHVFGALAIDSQRHDQAFLPEIFGINEQHLDVRRHGPLAKFLQLRGRGRFPLPAHAGAANAVALQALVNRPGVIPGGNLPD